MKVLFIILQSIYYVWFADPHYEHKAHNENYAHNWTEASKTIDFYVENECWEWISPFSFVSTKREMRFCWCPDSTWIEIKISCGERAKTQRYLLLPSSYVDSLGYWRFKVDTLFTN